MQPPVCMWLLQIWDLACAQEGTVFKVSPHQMCFLMLFNDCKILSFCNIANEKNIPEAVLICTSKTFHGESCKSNTCCARLLHQVQ
uniref:Putative secreted protein n=1 Tax=Rhipicephalus microplus TaxID=6941 RepID=A0A6M2DBP2_RHIMP